MNKRGLILVYTGDGKGKTTAALGLGLRASGYNSKVRMVQFMKGGMYTGELAAVKYLPDFQIYQAGKDEFVFVADQEDISEAEAGFALAKELAKEADLLILDEINVAVRYGLLPIEEVRDFILNKPEELDLVLTGRDFPEELYDLVDLISEVKEVKHHYRQGIPAKKGIEF